MQEKHVTVAGARYDLPKPFHVLATQNPLEQEGTYPLPEAQLDRFLLQIDVGYPDPRIRKADAARHDLRRRRPRSTPVCTPPNLMEAQAIVRRLPVGEKVVDAILRLVRAARPDEGGATDIRAITSPGGRARAPARPSCWRCARKALLEGRFAPSYGRCGGAGPARAAPSHGAQFLRARRRHHDRATSSTGSCRSIL